MWKPSGRVCRRARREEVRRTCVKSLGACNRHLPRLVCLICPSLALFATASCCSHSSTPAKAPAPLSRSHKPTRIAPGPFLPSLSLPVVCSFFSAPVPLLALLANTHAHIQTHLVFSSQYPRAIRLGFLRALVAHPRRTLR